MFQVVDFLSGKAPLNLTMRLGDHMMLIQLQLSTVNSSSNLKRTRGGGPVPASVSRTPVSSTTGKPATPTTPSPSSSSSSEGAGPTTSSSTTNTSYKPKLDTRALSEASKNLTQTLKQLSSEVLTTKCEEVSKVSDIHFKLLSK